MDGRRYPETADKVFDSTGAELGKVGHIYGKKGSNWLVQVDGIENSGDDNKTEITAVEIHGDPENESRITEVRWELV